MLLAILGLVEAGEGRIAVYGDSNCLDSSHMVTDCYWLLKKILNFTGKNIKDPILFSHSLKLQHPLDENYQLPIRRTGQNHILPGHHAIDLGSGLNSLALPVFVQRRLYETQNWLAFLKIDIHWKFSDRQGIEERKEVAPIDKLISGR
ncbi:hypothetical protein Tco_0562408 [Tanacetum coccineum]